MTMTLTNDFHNTSVSIRPRNLRGNQFEVASATVARWARKLCPSTGCTCSGELGTRGRNPVAIVDQHEGRVLLSLTGGR